LASLVGALLLVAVGIAGAGPNAVAGAAKDAVTILVAAAAELDPARQGDIDSARVGAQLFETLTAIDPTLTVRPALAGSWDLFEGGRRIVFHMRSGLTFSDGTPLTGADVVRSWLRIVDPNRPSPLASLMFDVRGAQSYANGQSSSVSQVDLRSRGLDVEVGLDRPAADFPAIVSSPTFAVVPPGIDTDPAVLHAGSGFVASGAYRLSAVTSTELTLTANDRYWAGQPAIGTVHLLTTLGGGSPVQAFEDGKLDYTPIGDDDAGWIRYDATLGPELRTVPSAGVTYYGFDTTRPPFSDVRVRQAFAWAVDWPRIVQLGSGGSAIPATSMVPPGIPGRSTTDFAPRHDPVAARAALAAAGYPGGAGFPAVTLVTTGGGYDGAVLADLQRELGISVGFESLDSADYYPRLADDTPQFWALGWVADYPGPNDFLGLLLGSRSSNDYGRWTSSDFDLAIRDAGAATDPSVARTAYDRAEAIVQTEVPVIPVAYGSGFALSRGGLLGATESGLGILRLAGLAWSP
jgi:ABC-type transport system substrate-binding protein